MATIRKVLTETELHEETELILQELEEDRKEKALVSAVYIPPKVADLTDSEDFDENVLLPYHNIKDVVGSYELFVDGEFDESNDKPPLPKLTKTCNHFPCPVWRKDKFSSLNAPTSNVAEKIERLEEIIGGKTPLEVFELFIDDEMLSMIVEFSNKYARSNSRHCAQIIKDDIKQFIGILLLTGYHRLPQMDLYWSNAEDVGVNLVKQTMSLNKFSRIKQNLHLSDNDSLNKTDKFTKLRPYFDLLNKRFIQFGIFADNLTIDKQMVPFLGRHSNQICIQGKSVHCGFKLWCLCSSDGYLFQFLAYGGTNQSKSKWEYDLAEEVVLDLLKFLDCPSHHRVFFNNFFTSYKLLSKLVSLGYCATGSVRENRTGGCDIESIKDISKKPQGSYSAAQDTSTGIIVTRWHDHSVVTIASNVMELDPPEQVKRFDRKQRKEILIPQPKIVFEYNKHMGGVYRHDCDVSNYRIRCNDRKWYWPLFTNSLNSVVVNSWKLYCLVNKSNISQLEFVSYIVRSLMSVESQNYSMINVTRKIRNDNVGHIIIQHSEKKRMRCKLCKSNTIYLCKKCNVHLHTECFEKFHT